jgi:uncharacterized protein
LFWQNADVLKEVTMILRVTLSAVSLVVGILATLPQPAEAQTFNCRTARQPAERAICQSNLLSALDVQMSNLYFRLIGSVGPQTARLIQADQRGWLQARNSCGYDFGCLESEYRRRIFELRSY